jgi:polyphosphate:AMP phosphotransferase
MLPEKSKFSEQYQLFEHVAERVIRQSDRGIAPWYLVEAEDTRYRDLTVGKTLLQAIHARLGQQKVVTEPATPSDPLQLPDSESAQVTLLDQLDLSQSLEKDAYKEQLKRLQAEVNELAWTAYKKRRTTVLVFEGVDAGGKGGAIRRITQAVDARLYRTIPVAAPTDEEKAHHYLWRFWRHIPRAGHMIIYDRSWYGRVLVERVEGFATEAEWRRAYSEINDFEEQLVENGAILMKFWLQVSDEEQLQRFKDREDTPYKRYKITDEDWRNREKWPEYKAAVNEMVARTSTEYAPWTLVEGDDKLFARVKVLQTVCDGMREGLKKKRGEIGTGVVRCGDLLRAEDG